MEWPQDGAIRRGEIRSGSTSKDDRCGLQLNRHKDRACKYHVTYIQRLLTYAGWKDVLLHMSLPFDDHQQKRREKGLGASEKVPSRV
jgi:hypothetical protein